jgi:hypothetical protein
VDQQERIDADANMADSHVADSHVADPHVAEPDRLTPHRGRTSVRNEIRPQASAVPPGGVWLRPAS